MFKDIKGLTLAENEILEGLPESIKDKLEEHFEELGNQGYEQGLIDRDDDDMDENAYEAGCDDGYNKGFEEGYMDAIMDLEIITDPLPEGLKLVPIIEYDGDGGYYATEKFYTTYKRQEDDPTWATHLVI